MGLQVYNATHDGEGNSLSVLGRHFISFSYGGKNIEDFDLIACTNGDRINKEIYAPFQDTTSKQSELDGQMYWLTSHDAGGMSFFLATDGMDVEKFEAFKAWFKPGVERELILAEYPNRVILARVSTAPTMNMLPFEKDVEVKVGSAVYSTKTTEYRGDITLDFVMDDPFWYSIESCFDGALTKEQAKVVFEDKIPATAMFDTKSYFVGGGKIVNNHVLSEQTGVALQPGTNYYLYDCGTAPTRPVMSFTFTPTISAGYVNFPGNSYTKTDYAYIQFGDKKFEFSTPSVLTGYNQAIQIATQYLGNNGASAVELRSLLRDGISHYMMRAWAVGIIDQYMQERIYTTNEGALQGSWCDNFIKIMKLAIAEGSTNGNTFTPFPISITCNNKNGSITLSTKVRYYDGSIQGSSLGDYSSALKCNTIDLEENCGDMVKSSYLYIEGNSAPVNGMITDANCLTISTNSTITNFTIDYRYAYL